MATLMGSTISYMIMDMGFNIGMPLRLFSCANSQLTYHLGYLCAGLSALSLVVVCFIIPDFTDRSYAQLNELFERRIHSRKFPQTVCTGSYGHTRASGQ
jgi:hypothetical protein